MVMLCSLVFSSLFCHHPHCSPAGLWNPERDRFHDGSLCLLCWINRSTVWNFNQADDESDLFDLGCTTWLRENDKWQQQQPIKRNTPFIPNLDRYSQGGRAVFSHSPSPLPPPPKPPPPHSAWPHLAKRNGMGKQTQAKKESGKCSI